MEKFGSGIRDKHPGSATLTTFMFKSPDVSSCRYWLRSEQLLVWLEALAAAGVVWLETLAAALRSEQLSLWFEGRSTAYGLSWGLWDLRCRYGLISEQLQVWIEVWAAAAIVQGKSEQAVCMVWFLSSCLYCLRSEQLPVWFWGLSSCWYGLRPAWGVAGMVWDLPRCQYGLRSEQLSLWFKVWPAASMVWGLSSSQ